MATDLTARVTGSDSRPVVNARINISDRNGTLLYTGQTNENGIAELRAAGTSDVWPPYPGVVLRRGMNGPSIRQVQARLNDLGANPRLATDGIFGPLTEVAVIAFQRANGLVPDGIVGDAVIIRPTQKTSN